MTKINWNRPKAIYNGIYVNDYVTDEKDINLGIHKTHELKVERSSPHYAKLSCKTCNKFIKWLSKTEYNSINRL